MAATGENPESIRQTARIASLSARLLEDASPSPAGPPGERIFISYRRDDSAGHVGRVYDLLRKKFTPEDIFIDLDAIDPGEDYLERMNKSLASTEVLIVIIGPHWLDVGGKRRLDEKKDPVRHEIVKGLKRNIPLVPVLIGGARMPKADQLPGALEKFARKNAIEIRDLHWDQDFGRFLAKLDEILGGPVDAEAVSAQEQAQKLAVKMVLAVVRFLRDGKPDYEDGDFVVAGAGAGKEAVPAVAVEIMRDGDSAWAELVSNVGSPDEVTAMNQVLSLQKLGWKAPPEGGYIKRWFRAPMLTRWWRDINAREDEKCIEDVTSAIIGTFTELYERLPQGIALGWASPPRRYPQKGPVAAPSTRLGIEFRARSNEWR